jgi:carbonic anhydrase
MLHTLSRLFVLVLFLGCAASLPGQAPADPAAPALAKLKEGNARFVADKLGAGKEISKRRTDVAKGQQPFAIVLACADSRVAPELVFDQGLGDIFVIRVAGNVTNADIIGSMEYAVQTFKTPLIVVIGHSECGAVAAALDDKGLTGNLGKLVKEVYVGKDLPKDKPAALEAAVKANVLEHAARLTRDSTVLKDFAASKRVRIVPAVYSLSSGEVKWLDK